MKPKRVIIPRRFKIRRRWWIVRFKTPPQDCVGMTFYKTAEIWIDPKLSWRQKQVVFIHELLHACMPRTKEIIGLSGHAEELFVNTVDGVLWNALRRLKWTTRR